MAALTTAAYTPNPQALPDYLSYSTYVTNVGGVVYTTEAVVQIPETYYGPSIPLGEGWTYGGSSSPSSTDASTSNAVTTPSSTSATLTASTTSRSITAASTSRQSSIVIPSSISNSPSNTASSSPTGISTTSSSTSSQTAGIASSSSGKSGLSKLGTILLSVLLPLAFLAGIGLCLFFGYRRRKRRKVGSPAVAMLGDDGSGQRDQPGGAKGHDTRGKGLIGLLPFWRRQRGSKSAPRNPNMIMGARYGLVSTTNSGNRALRVQNDEDMERDLSGTPPPRNDADDGYEPVGLGVPRDGGWADEGEEYLHDFDEGSDQNPRRYGAFGQRGIQHLHSGPSDLEDDIVNSYMARTPAVSNEGSFTNDPALSPASMRTDPFETSPSMGTDASSPSAQAASPGLMTGKSTGSKWGIGAAIGLGMPRRARSSQSQNQMRRRTPGSITTRGRRDSAEDRNIDGEGRVTANQFQDTSRTGQRPSASPHSSAAGSTSASGRGWNWLNGLGIAHVFGGRSPEMRNAGGDAAGWSQSRVPSSNIWGVPAQPGGYQPTASSEDQYQDALDDSSTRNSRHGTIRLVQSHGNAALNDGDNGPNSVTRREILGPDREDDESDLAFLPGGQEARQGPDPMDSSLSPDAPDVSEETRRDSSDSDDSFTRNQNRESTGFRDAVLAALGFSSGHSRPNSGVAGSPPTADPTMSSHADPAQASSDGHLVNRASRDNQPELFSLPPTDTAYSLDRLATVGLGLNYVTTQTDSQLSHLSQSDNWDALYREHSADLDLDSDMLDFSSPSHLSNSRSGSGSVFPSAHTPASTNRSPAMMSTGPMPHSEQFHPESDEPVPEIPDNKPDGSLWSQEDQREFALFSTAFSTPTSPESARSAIRRIQPSDTNIQTTPDRPSTLAQAVVSSTFPAPPTRQIATSPRGLRPRPSAGTLRKMSETGSGSSTDLGRIPQASIKPLLPSHQVEDAEQVAQKAIVTPSKSTFAKPDLFSPQSVFSTNTFGGDVAVDPAKTTAGVRSPDSSNDAGKGRDYSSRSRLSHLFADANHRLSGTSSVEPMSGNTFSSFRQQQDYQGSGQPTGHIDDQGVRISRRMSDETGDPADRWSMASFPGQPIVPAEVYRQAVSNDAATTNPALTALPQSSRKSRPLPIPMPISTRSPIEVQNEYGVDNEGHEDSTGTATTNMAMGDASGTAKSAVLVRPLSYLAPPSSQAGSFFTAHSSSSSAKSHTDAGSTPAHSPLEVDQMHGQPHDGERDDLLQQMLPKERSSVPGSGRRPKFSNSSASSAMAVPTLKPLDERFEDGFEVDDEPEQRETRIQSLSAVHGRRSMPQLVATKQALGQAPE